MSCPSLCGVLALTLRRVDYPTAAFIDKYDTVYNNPNWTVWADTGELMNG
jgi:hypothetical protein